MKNLTLLDCTLRDGGYYNAWDFPPDVVDDYLKAMKSAGVDVVELGFRFLQNEGFKGPFAFTTDSFLRSLAIPDGLQIGVMVNGADLCTEIGWQAALERLFPSPAAQTQVHLVRIACHFKELEAAFNAAEWLAQKGYRVGINLMQIADRTPQELKALAQMAQNSSIEVLYFADSMGSMTPIDTTRVIQELREGWNGAIGIHTHDNMGQAVANSLAALDQGATWVDATVTGMGRGPGNAQTEVLAVALRRNHSIANLVPLFRLVRTWFAPAKARYGWGTNPYYYLAGAYGIHPTYIQNMLDDDRYDEEDRIAVIEYLSKTGSHTYSSKHLELARRLFDDDVRGSWNPTERFESREVLILGSGPSVQAHRQAIEAYIQAKRPLVVALNLNNSVSQELIDLRVACHPVRLLADAQHYAGSTQPLILPKSMLPADVVQHVAARSMLDFGVGVEPDTFKFEKTYAVVPTSLVIAYALALANSGQAQNIRLAGFDGYAPGDERQQESQRVFSTYLKTPKVIPIESITSTTYRIPSSSVYSLN
jgi:4-hydroxy 2-oxovalerate aldolase